MKTKKSNVNFFCEIVQHECFLETPLYTLPQTLEVGVNVKGGSIDLEPRVRYFDQCPCDRVGRGLDKVLDQR